jgi:hypothetical protein
MTNTTLPNYTQQVCDFINKLNLASFKVDGLSVNSEVPSSEVYSLSNLEVHLASYLYDLHMCASTAPFLLKFYGYKSTTLNSR